MILFCGHHAPRCVLDCWSIRTTIRVWLGWMILMTLCTMYKANTSWSWSSGLLIWVSKTFRCDVAQTPRCRQGLYYLWDPKLRHHSLQPWRFEVTPCQLKTKTLVGLSVTPLGRLEAPKNSEYLAVSARICTVAYIGSPVMSLLDKELIAVCKKRTRY